MGAEKESVQMINWYSFVANRPYSVTITGCLNMGWPGAMCVACNLPLGM